jgi:hypothetical protein
MSRLTFSLALEIVAFLILSLASPGWCQSVTSKDTASLATGTRTWSVNVVGSFVVGDVVMITYAPYFFTGTITAINALAPSITVDATSTSGPIDDPWSPWSFTLVSSPATSASSSTAPASPSASPSTGSGSAYPTGTYAFTNLIITPSGPITSATAYETEVVSDIAYNIANATGGNNATTIVPYVQLTNFNNTQLTGRRLLSTGSNITVSFIILGTISSVLPSGVSPLAVVQDLQNKMSSGTFATPSTGASVPAQPLTFQYVGATSSSSTIQIKTSSSSTGNTQQQNNGASGLTFSAGALAVAAASTLTLLL